MAKFKNIVGGCGAVVGVAFVLLAFVTSCHRDLVDPYTWDDVYREQAREAGWELAAEYEAGELVLPWTWFWPPVFSLGYVRPDSIYRGGGRVYAKVLWLRRSDDGDVERDLSPLVFDCDSSLFGAVPNTFEVDDFQNAVSGPSPEQWLDMSEQLKDYFCEPTIDGMMR